MQQNRRQTLTQWVLTTFAKIKPRFSLQKHQQAPKVPHSVWTNPVHFIACGFGIGAIPWMPGTFATLASIPLCLILSRFSLLIYITITLLLILIGIFLCHKTNRDFGCEDHPAAVWDEFATFPIVMIAIPPTWYFLSIGFVAFRLLDIYKPGPIGWLDKHVHGGIGVMLDDVASALVAWILLQAIIWFFPY